MTTPLTEVLSFESELTTVKTLRYTEALDSKLTTAKAFAVALDS